MIDSKWYPLLRVLVIEEIRCLFVLPLIVWNRWAAKVTAFYRHLLFRWFFFIRILKLFASEATFGESIEVSRAKIIKIDICIRYSLLSLSLFGKLHAFSFKRLRNRLDFAATHILGTSHVRKVI